jgi:hypothetical protein
MLKSKGKICIAEEPSQVKQRFLNLICIIGLINTGFLECAKIIFDQNPLLLCPRDSQRDVVYLTNSALVNEPKCGGGGS